MSLKQQIAKAEAFYDILMANSNKSIDRRLQEEFYNIEHPKQKHTLVTVEEVKTKDGLVVDIKHRSHYKRRGR